MKIFALRTLEPGGVVINFPENDPNLTPEKPFVTPSFFSQKFLNTILEICIHLSPLDPFSLSYLYNGISKKILTQTLGFFHTLEVVSDFLENRYQRNLVQTLSGQNFFI